MSAQNDFDLLLRAWFDESASSRQPEGLLDAVLEATGRSRPRQAWLVRLGGEPMLERSRSRLHRSVPLVLASTVVVVMLLLGISLIVRPPNIGPPPTPSRTTPTQTATQTNPASPTSVEASPIDTTNWTTYESDRYGFSIGHPPDWTEVPADHDWTTATDAQNGLSTGQEAFIAPDGSVRVSAWSLPGLREGLPGVTVRAEDYCEAANNGPCTGIRDRAVPLCFETFDCHPGLLVPFENDVQAFFTGSNGRMVVVAVWSEESAPAVAQFGGSQRLLLAFLATMGVCEAGDGPESRGAGCS